MRNGMKNKIKKGTRVKVPTKKTLLSFISSRTFEQIKDEYPDIFNLPYWVVEDVHYQFNCCNFNELKETNWLLEDLELYD